MGKGGKKKRKRGYVRKEDFIVPLAYFHRYGMPVLIVCGAMVCPRRLLAMGIGCLVLAAWSFVGYKCRWKHIFCSYQNAYHAKMTPNDIDWAWISKVDAYGVPAFFAVMGVVGVITSIFVE